MADNCIISSRHSLMRKIPFQFFSLRLLQFSSSFQPVASSLRSPLFAVLLHHSAMADATAHELVSGCAQVVFRYIPPSSNSAPSFDVLSAQPPSARDPNSLLLSNVIVMCNCSQVIRLSLLLVLSFCAVFFFLSYFYFNFFLLFVGLSFLSCRGSCSSIATL